MVRVSNCFWIKPNKLNKQGRLIDQKGSLILADADQLICLDNFDALAIRKEKAGKSIILQIISSYWKMSVLLR